MKKLLTALMIALPAVASAQPPSQPQGGFVPIDQLPTPESFPAAPLVIAAYAVAWLVIFFYVWSVWRRLNRVEAELTDALKRFESRTRP